MESPARRLGSLLAWGFALAIGAAAVGARAAAGDVTIAVGNASGYRGEIVMVAVRLQVDGEEVAGTQNDITYDPRFVNFVALADGTPDCTVSSGLNKEASAFAFRPRGCDPVAGDCRVVRAIILSFENIDAIADGSILYSCRVEITDEAPPGEYRLMNDTVMWAPPPGGDRTALAVEGVVTVLDGTAPTHTPAVSPTGLGTATPLPDATPTPAGEPGDTNCDLSIDDLDRVAVMHAIFGLQPTSCSADCNGDSRVTSADLGCIAVHWANGGTK